MNFHNDVPEANDEDIVPNVPEPVEDNNFTDDLLQAVNTLASGESVKISLHGVDRSIWLMPFNHLYTRKHSFTHVPIEIRVEYDADAEAIRICNWEAPPAPPAPPEPDPVKPLSYSPQSKWFN